MKLFRILSLVLPFLFFFSSLLLGQKATVPQDSLTMEQAIKLAIEHHPSLRVAHAGLRVAESNLTQAEASYYPTATAVATATGTAGWFVFNPAFPPRYQAYYRNYSTGFQFQQLIYDFGKTGGRVRANDKLVEATGADFQSARDNVVMNVQLAYLSLVQALRVVKVNAAAVEQATRHLQRAKAFFSVGKRPQIDITKSEVELANANVNLIRARNQVRTARLSLENAMGFHPTRTYAVTDTFFVRPFTMPLDSIRAITTVRRPDLQSARTRVAASRALVTSAWAQNLPTVSAVGAYTWNGFDLPLVSRWSAGVSLNLPIFQGFAIQAQIQQARANQDAAQANLDQLTETILTDVEQNYLGLKEAEERISAASKLVEQAAQNVNLTEKQYAAGVATALEVTDAQVLLSNAQIISIQALYDYNSSLIRLRRSIGIINP